MAPGTKAASKRGQW